MVEERIQGVEHDQQIRSMEIDCLVPRVHRGLSGCTWVYGQDRAWAMLANWMRQQATTPNLKRQWARPMAN